MNQTIKVSIDLTDEQYTHLELNDLDSLYEVIFAEGNINDCCGTIICSRNQLNSQLSFAVDKEHGIYIGIFEDKKSLLSLNDYGKLAETIDVWGANWCTPNKEDMEHLVTAAKGETDEKVKCEYTQENSVWGFKFTGLTDGYTDNSVFFPTWYVDSNFGDADYWSATADGSKACEMYLRYFYGDWDSTWYSVSQNYECLVRPVLKK